MSSNYTSVISSNATSSALTTDFPKAVVTIGILAGAVLICLAVAKLVDWCYKRRDVRDDSSDISEHTKELLRNQLEIMRIGKKQTKDATETAVAMDSRADINTEDSDKRASEAMNAWSTKVLGKAKQLEKAEISADNGAFHSEDTPATLKPKEDPNVPKKPIHSAEISAAVAATLADPNKPRQLKSLPKPGSTKSPAPLPKATPQASVISKSNPKLSRKSPQMTSAKKMNSQNSARSDSI